MGKRVSSVHRGKGTKNKKILASLLVLAATGVAGVGATTSAFTDEATATTTVTAGTIDLKVNDTKSVTFHLGTAGTKWAPGMTQTSTLTLKNSGTLPMTVNMATTTTGSTTGLANKLTTTITNTTGTPEVLQPSVIMKNAKITNLVIPAGGTAALKIDAVWPTGTNDNTFAGKTDTVTYTFSATNS